MTACASAEEVQARLALRALWGPAQASTNTQGGDDSVPTTSTFHRHLRAEFDDVLKASLSRRHSRLERHVNRLIEGQGNGNNNAQEQENIEHKAATNGNGNLAPASTSVNDEGVQTNSSGSQDYWLEERKWGDTRPDQKLADSFVKAYNRAVQSTWPLQKKWGPSRRQNNFEDPPYKEEKLEKEVVTIRATLATLNQNVNSRERQLGSLKAQIAEAKKIEREDEGNVAQVEETLRQVQDPSKLPSAQEKRRKLQKEAHDKVEKDLKEAKAEATRYQGLVKQQHAFFMQAETIYCQERGAERMQRFPAGEVFLVPQPLPMDDDKGGDSWDVGTAVANPYEVDSWPFEPNVLARRCPKECPMDNVTEETLEDLMEAQRPGRTNPFRGPGLNLNLRNDEEDDGPTTTSRSL